MMANDNTYLDDSSLTVVLVCAAAAAFAITVYHCITVDCCNRHQPSPSQSHPRHFVPDNIESPSSIENSMVHLIPAYIYQKGVGLLHDNGTCAVCLCEFEDGEELRTLPECLHSYHVSCIDMWLYSHSNCPMCRTDATPSPQIFPPTVSGTESLESGTLQNIVVEPRSM